MAENVEDTRRLGVPTMGADEAWLAAAIAEVDAVRGALRPVGAETVRPPDGSSAVIAPFVPTPKGLCLLFERRPEGASRFAGHLSFPGGRIEPDDASPLAAALREAHEEVGFTPQDVEVLGHLADTMDPRGRMVAAFAGVVPLRAVPDVAASSAEVAELILVPVPDLIAPGTTHAGAAMGWPMHVYRAVSYESRALPSHERIVQYWSLHAVHGVRTATLWGFTGGLVAAILHRAYAWEPPSAPRIIERWEEFLP